MVKILYRIAHSKIDDKLCELFVSLQCFVLNIKPSWSSFIYVPPVAIRAAFYYSLSESNRHTPTAAYRRPAPASRALIERRGAARPLTV
jgi:hypothetical protein